MKKRALLFFVFHFSFFIFHLNSEAQIIHVPADYPTIQQGIDAANPGDTVLVADGVYYGQISFLGKKPLVVSSQYFLDGDTSHISNTIINGSQLTNMDLSSVVYFTNGEDTSSVLCGFTITGGRGTYVIEDNERCGGGIFISGSGARIIHNRITGNTLDDTQPVNGQNVFGAGIGTKSEYGDYWLVIEGNRIIGNNAITKNQKAHGGGIHASYHCLISNNLISENLCTNTATGGATGGGIGHSGGVEAPNTFIISNNVIHHNLCEAPYNAYGAGIYLAGVLLSLNYNEISENQVVTQTAGPAAGGLSYSDPFPGARLSNNITHNIFRGNVGRNGGGAIFLHNTMLTNDPAVLVIANNYFEGNEAVNGGAIVTWGIPMALTNNVFFGNHAALRGGALFLQRIVNVNEQRLAILINNSFLNNAAESSGGAIYSSYGYPLIFNSVLYGDSAPEGTEIYLNFSADTIDLAYTNVDLGLIHGNIKDWGGNINADPAFLDDTCHIEESSPCEDMGEKAVTIREILYAAPEEDFEGTPRPWHEGIDIGADECDIITGLPGPGKAVNSSKFTVRSYPNPTDGISHFAFHISQYQWVSLKVYNAQGQEVATVLDGEWSGDQVVGWDASNLPAGIYFYLLRAKGVGQVGAGKIVKY